MLFGLNYIFFFSEASLLMSMRNIQKNVFLKYSGAYRILKIESCIKSERPIRSIAIRLGKFQSSRIPAF